VTPSGPNPGPDEVMTTKDAQSATFGDAGLWNSARGEGDLKIEDEREQIGGGV
jgi:hypothetical protein